MEKNIANSVQDTEVQCAVLHRWLAHGDIFSCVTGIFLRLCQNSYCCCCPMLHARWMHQSCGILVSFSLFFNLFSKTRVCHLSNFFFLLCPPNRLNQLVRACTPKQSNTNVQSDFVLWFGRIKRRTCDLPRGHCAALVPIQFIIDRCSWA